MAYESLLMCKKCHGNLLVPKRIVVRKLTVFVWAQCVHCGKAVQFTLPLPQIQDWVDPIAENFFKCPRDGVTGVVTRTIMDGDFTKIRLHCSSCQKAFVKVAYTAIFNYLMASHYNQMRRKAETPVYYVPMTQMPQMPPTPMQVPQMPPISGQIAPAGSGARTTAPPMPTTPPAPPQTLLKKCTNCSAPLPPDASFCRKCGVPIEAGVDKAPRCPFCGATLSAAAKVCPKCSSEVRCPKCDALLSPNARFCVKCGDPIKGKVKEVEKPLLTCHFCGASLELEQKVCPECGKPTVCGQCGNHLKSGVRFCNKCGADVSEITLTPKTADEEPELDEDEIPKEEAKTVKCPSCGADMSEIYTFCTICGNKLEK